MVIRQADLAEDTRLHRKVALKLLPAEVGTNKGRMRRFEQEAQAAAALNHPNIAHIYEVDESDGATFIAMEFIDGFTLRDLELVLIHLRVEYHCPSGETLEPTAAKVSPGRA